MRHGLALGVFLGWALCTANLAAAAPAAPSVPANCQMARFATLPITTQRDGRISVPVTLQGLPASFLVDTGGISATMSYQIIKDMGRTPQDADRWLGGVGGSLLNTFIFVDDFSIGRLKGTKLPVYVDPRISGMGVDGTLSPDMMHNFDVDIDFAHSTLNLFSADHCPGRAVYWTQTGFIAIPIDVAPNGHIRFPVQVDGKTIMAMMDTGAVNSVMSLDAAKALGITADSPDLKLKRTLGFNKDLREFSYPFKTLDLDGISVKNPHITIMSNDLLKGFGKDMILGIGMLRRLHVYIAYKEKMIYLTPAAAN